MYLKERRINGKESASVVMAIAEQQNTFNYFGTFQFFPFNWKVEIFPFSRQPITAIGDASRYRIINQIPCLLGRQWSPFTPADEISRKRFKALRLTCERREPLGYLR